MANVLIQFAHPLLSKSRVHAALLRACSGLSHVTVNDLYEQYPDLFIDVEREQQLLLEHDIIIFQHPFYWYSSPAIVKQWFDLVLEHNWAYGSRGTALAGKMMLNAISCGGGRTVYSPQGANQYTINQFLIPFERTAILCKMAYLPPFVVHGTHRLEKEEIEQYGEQYRTIVQGLIDGSITPSTVGQAQYINDLVAGPMP